MVAMFVSKILILGSGPNVIEILEQDLSGYDKIVVINSGRIVEEGTHNELKLKRGLYFQLSELQEKGFANF